MEERHRAESISSVLYPSDSTHSGKELRLKQQYFFVCATLQDIVRRFKKRKGWKWSEFPQKNAVQLNDTHPSIAIAELMRLLIDTEEGLSWDEAWVITTVRRGAGDAGQGWLTRAAAAGDVWVHEPHDPARGAREVVRGALRAAAAAPLADHLQVRAVVVGLPPRAWLTGVRARARRRINWHFLQEVERRWPGDTEKQRKLSIVEESPRMVCACLGVCLAVCALRTLRRWSRRACQIRMAHLAIIGAHCVNGVAAIHSELLKTAVFPEFYELYRDRFTNITNGVTPRRWMNQVCRRASACLRGCTPRFTAGSDARRRTGRCRSSLAPGWMAVSG